MSTILVTGGAGFIGSHTCVELLESGYDVVVIDNLSNACEESLKRVEKITGKTLKFYKGDIADKELMDKILTENDIYAVIHFSVIGISAGSPYTVADELKIIFFTPCLRITSHIANVPEMLFV